MERRTSGIGPRLHHTIAFALDGLDERLVGGRGRPRQADRRHLAVAQLGQHLFPGLAMGVEMGEIEVLEIEFCACLGTRMAGVAIDLPGLPDELLIEGPVIGGCGGRGRFFRGWSGRGQEDQARQYHAYGAQRSGTNHVWLPAPMQSAYQDYTMRMPAVQCAGFRLVSVCLRSQFGGKSAPRSESGNGWVAEWFKAPVLKTGRGSRLSGVRIPPHPPHQNRIANAGLGRLSPDATSTHWSSAHRWRSPGFSRQGERQVQLHPVMHHLWRDAPALATFKADKPIAFHCPQCA